MDLMTLRIAAIVVILVIGLLGGLLPMWIGYTPRTQRFFSLGNALSAGIFLSAGLIHMLPDAEENLRGVLGEFPVASLIAVLGFFIVLFVERVVSSAEAEADEARRGAVYAYILALVLSIHAFIAGVAVGTEQTAAGLLVLLIAIIAHKGSEAFALGLSMVRGNISGSRIPRTIGIFAFMTPLGIVFGSLLSTALTGHTAMLFAGIFDALAAGTFIYVSVLDVIGEEFALPGDRLAKFALAALGSGAMAIVGIWA